MFWDDDYALMVRRDGPNRELLERLEYRLFLPGFDYSGETAPEDRAALIREMERNQAARRLPSAELHSALGILNLRAGDAAQAESHFRRATLVDDSYAPAWANLGLLLLKTGRPAAAETALARAVRLDPRLEFARAKLAEIRQAGP